MSGGTRAVRVAVVSAVVIGGGSLLAGWSRPTLPAAAAQPAASTALAADLDLRLGLPVPAGRRAERLTDAGSGMSVVEVTDLAADGTPIAISRFDLGGGLVSSVRLGFAPDSGPAIPAASAEAGAAQVLARLGVTASGAPVTSSRASGGWLVRWTRVVGSVPVPGDGVGVQLAIDGTFRAVVRTEHRLGPTPPVLISAADAQRGAAARLDRWLSPDLRPDAAVASVGLAWIAPNDTFGDSVPTDAAGLLRLAWIVRVTTSGSLADRVAGLELAFDAGDGAPLGGDLLE